MGTADEKKTLRQLLIQKLQSQELSEIEEKSRSVLEQVLHSKEIIDREVFLCYVSFGYEVKTHQLIKELLKRKKTVLIPRVDNNTKEITAIQIEDLEQDTYLTKLGILEPKKDLPPYEDFQNKIDVIFVPGIAFDQKGNRLGRGWGCYDRLLITCPHSQHIGLCFDFQILPSLPLSEHDVALHQVISSH